MITVFIYIIGLQIVFLYSLLGPLLVLLKNAFTIDAIGHSIVFGIAGGFLISHSLHSPWLFMGAVLSAFIMNFINEVIQKNSLIEIDASLGISFSTLFSAGILLISLYAKNIHLDLDMILLGNIEYALYDMSLIGGFFIPRIIIILSAFIIFFISFFYFFYGQIELLLFDKEFAKIKGVFVHFLLSMFIVLFTILVVVTFQAMGSLLLLGIAVAPFGFSWGIVPSYREFIINGLVYGLLSGFLGIMISLYCDTSVSATITFSITTMALLKYFCFNRYRKI
jgi:manganese/zinc/iron transport system permease protein